MSSASVHDSQKLEDVLDANNTGSTVWADSAYRSKEIEASSPSAISKARSIDAGPGLSR